MFAEPGFGRGTKKGARIFGGRTGWQQGRGRGVFLIGKNGGQIAILIRARFKPTHRAQAPLMGFIEDNNAVLGKMRVCQDLSQQTAIRHILDWRSLHRSTRHSVKGWSTEITAPQNFDSCVTVLKWFKLEHLSFVKLYNFIYLAMLYKSLYKYIKLFKVTF